MDGSELWRGRARESRTGAEPPNAIGVTPQKLSQLTTALATAYTVATDTTEAGSATYTIAATAHAARIGDVIRFTTGSNTGLIAGVFSTDTNSITLDVDANVGVGDDFEILRLTPAKVDSSGVLSTTGTGATGDVNIVEVGGNAVTTTVPVSGTVSVTEPVSVDDNGGSLTVDGTVAVSSVGGTVAISAVSLPLPTGAATAANQLPDGHNVTVDNAAGAAAVNIQDGGNSITVDGAVTVSGTVSVTEPVSVDDNGGSLTVDGTVAATQSGTWILGANSGVDIGDVTINNAAGASAVNVQDGGNSLTVDGTVAATQSGTWNIGTVTTVTTLTNFTNQGQLVDNAAFTDGTTRLNMAGFIFDEVAGTALTENDGAAARVDSKRAQVFTLEDATTRGQRATVTAANALKVDGSAVTQPVSGTVTANQGGTWNIGTVTTLTGITNTVTVQGETAAGAALTDNPVPIAGRSLGGNVGVPFVNDLGGGITLLGVQPIDGSLNFISFNTDGSEKVTGNVAHDAVDTNGPVKTGGKAASYAPATSNQPSANKTAVASGDRTDGAFNLYGEAVEGVNPFFFTLDNVSTTYNNTTTTATSTAKDCWNYRQASFACDLTRANSPTDILFEVEVSLDGTNYQVMQNDFLGDLRESTASITASGVKRSWTFPIAAQKIRIKATATGTTAVNTITVANAALYLRN